MFLSSFEACTERCHIDRVNGLRRLLIDQVMGRHDRLHQQLGHVQREMGGPGNPNPDPRMEMHFNMLFKSKLAAEVLILVRRASLPWPVRVETHLQPQ